MQCQTLVERVGGCKRSGHSRDASQQEGEQGHILVIIMARYFDLYGQ